MGALPIVRLGHPSLRFRSKPVTARELADPTVQRFIDDLVETCLAAKGAGIASPQVGVNRRIIVVNVDPSNSRYPERPEFPMTVVVNPEVKRRSKEVDEDWEGDLSADLRGLVPRSRTCTVTGWDRKGAPVEFQLEGFHARVFQHEIDHLDGVFLTDRVRKVETIAELPMWERYWTDRKSLPAAGEEYFQFPEGIKSKGETT